MRALRIKICGLRDERELVMLDHHRVDFAGVPVATGAAPDASGSFGLPIARAAALLGLRLRHVQPVAVTLGGSFGVIDPLVQALAPSALQLHGFDLPGCARRLKTAYGDRLTLLKVLHLQGDRCVEDALLERYVDAGVDLFVLDTCLSPARPGSTGQLLHLEAAARALARLAGTGVLVAGGIGPATLGSVRDHLSPFGIDVDSAVKRAGHLDEARLIRLLSAARGAHAPAPHRPRPDHERRGAIA